MVADDVKLSQFRCVCRPASSTHYYLVVARVGQFCALMQEEACSSSYKSIQQHCTVLPSSRLSVLCISRLCILHLAWQGMQLLGDV